MQINSVDTAKVSKTDRIDMYASGSSSDASTKSNAKISNITNPKEADVRINQPSTAAAAASPSTSASHYAHSSRSYIANQSRHAHSTFSINKNEEFEFEIPKEAPVYAPNDEEFKNPLTYINKIRPHAEKFGICKIRPPPTWQPPFTVDVDKLRFTPRVQRLNELEARTRVKLNFLDQIAKFWELQGSSLKIPMVERKALDLYSLHRLVHEEGGLEQTTNGRKWSKIATRMGYPSGKSVGTILKGHYERILHPFDIFTSGKSDEVKPKLDPDSDDKDYKPHGIVSRQSVKPPTETSARRSQRVIANAEIKSENDCDDCDDSTDAPKTIDAPKIIEAPKTPRRATPQKQNVSDSAGKLNGSSQLDMSPNKAELKRLQIFGAGPKMPGIKAKGKNQETVTQTTPIKSRMNGSSASSSRPQRQTANTAKRNMADPLAKYICHICTRGDGEENMLLCDGCDDSYHTFCLIPPLADIPKGDWRCPKCVVEEVSKPTEAFGFEQAQREYTLQQFGEMADQFKADYFNIPVHLVPTELVEREFWRIVSSIEEDVAVEYGADLHTMDHGSGFPTKNSLYLLPGDLEYADSSWNLNNLPLLEESVLGHINADISGMKVPWMYVGMCFATFCWHNEDHWSYSINYLHWGEPKTWYGVPGHQAEDFEETMRSAAPELFQSQPDLLHQLVTIMNPNTLMNAGVDVYRTDQHAGEFIITFPRAYHAGFNQGYNFAEAVNFAPADWIKMGRECINHYSNLRRFCVFSHDELVCKMALDPDKLNIGIATACYLDMAEMVDTEKKLRKCLLEWGVTRAEREAFELIPDDERQCEVCKTTCFLSAVTCTCIKAIVCLRHYSELCKCTPEKHTLKYRYTLDELPLMLKKLKAKADSLETWKLKVRYVLDPTTPKAKSLVEVQQLAQEARDKRFPSSKLSMDLNKAVVEAEKCVTVIHQLDINKSRTRTRNSAFEIAKYKLTMKELDQFVTEIDELCCVIKEGSSVRELQNIGKEYIELATYLLKEPINSIVESNVAKMIEKGSALCIDLPQLRPLRALHEMVKWYKEVRRVRDLDENIPLDDVKKLLSDGHDLNKVDEVDDSLVQQELQELETIVLDVEQWEADALKCFESGTQHDIPEIEDLLDRAGAIEGELPSQSLLEDALRKAKEWISTVDNFETAEAYPYIATLENVVRRGKDIPFQLEELKRMEEHLVTARTWKQKTARSFLRRNSVFDLNDVLAPRSSAVMLMSNAMSAAAGTLKSSATEISSLNIWDEKTYTDDKTPVQVVAAFKEAEAQESIEMKKLRQKNQNKNPEKDKYCVCHQPFHGIMYKCQLCCDWFHAGCVRNYPSTCATNSIGNRASTSQAVDAIKPGSRARDRDPKYLCESCHRTKRPSLNTILMLLVSLQNIRLRLPEGEALQYLAERVMRWQDRADEMIARSSIASAISIIKSHANAAEPSADPMAASMGEHAYSFPADQQSNQLPAPQITTPVTVALLSSVPLVQLSPQCLESLKQLIIEGDLFEVDLEQKHILWRVYNATKPEITDLAIVRLKYNITPQVNEALVSNIRKRHLDEHQNEAFMKKSRIRTHDYSIDRQRISDDDDEDNNDDDDMENIANFENELARSSDQAADSTRSTAQKPKRGRKMAMTTKDTDAMCTTIEESTTIVSDSTDLTQCAKKKKRGRKSGTNTTPTDADTKEETKTSATTSTSDEDEECRALNCIRPTGREVDWVQCDGGCNEWFHMLCVGLIKSQIKPDDDYICKKCKRTTPTEKAQTPTNNGTKKPKNGINNGETSADTNTNSTKKRASRGGRSKTATPTSVDTNESTEDSSKENESMPSNRASNTTTPTPSTTTTDDPIIKSENQSINTARSNTNDK